MAEVMVVCGDSKHSENGGAYLVSNMHDIVFVPMGYGFTVALSIGR